MKSPPIIWHSNSPLAGSGYGVQTALFTPMLAEHYELVISANYGLDGSPLIWEGIPVLPGFGSDHGNIAIPEHVPWIFGEPRNGLLITLYDAQVFDPVLFSKLNVACWTPIDTVPPPPGLITFFRESQAIPIAMSRFGQEELAEFDPLYVPHGVDTEMYKPTSSDIREKLGVPEDAFLIGMVAANKGHPARKSFQQAFEAFRYIRERHEDAYLYLHTTVNPSWAQGEDITAMLGSLEIPVESVKFTSQYSMVYAPVPRPQMAQLYSAFDVLLNPSMGEGFGVPIIEAAACGTSSIVTDFSAMPEVGGPTAWKIPSRPWWAAHRTSWQAVPDVPAIVEALEECRALSKQERDERATAARNHALQYDARRVFNEHMLPAIAEVEERIGMRKPELVAA